MHVTSTVNVTLHHTYTVAVSLCVYARPMPNHFIVMAWQLHNANHAKARPCNNHANLRHQTCKQAITMPNEWHHTCKQAKIIPIIEQARNMPKQIGGIPSKALYYHSLMQA